MPETTFPHIRIFSQMIFCSTTNFRSPICLHALLPGRALNLIFLVQRRPRETGQAVLQAEGHMGLCPPSTAEET